MSQDTTAEVFVELLCEELPAGMIGPALEGLAAGLTGLLDSLGHGAVRTWATPRRLAVAVADVPAEKPVVEIEVTGPPADRAFDADGQPTKTGVGFARGKGVDPSALRVVELPKRGRVAAVTVREGGETVQDVLLAGLADVVAGIPFAKAMVWADGDTLPFGRPLHQLVVTYGGAPLSGTVHDIPLRETTRGHRLTPGPFAVTTADAWVADLRAHHVEPDVAARTAAIQALLVEAAERLGSDPIVDDELLAEVTHLVEWPVLVLGAFDEELLELPPRLLVTSMKVHQRYFPVFQGGRLTHRFVVVSNNPFGDHDTIAEGNARVLRPRFHDARFFFAEDRAKPLAEHAAALPRMRWIRGLGTMADKAERIARLGAWLAPKVGAEPGVAERAGRLTKADLPTQMVGEFPELQGHVGRLYAAAEGASEAVSLAIEEHYLPRFAGDDVASTPGGVALALADRLDTLTGCFGIGLEPRGGGDPQGLRRAALGLVHTLVRHGLHLDLRRLFEEAWAVFDRLVRERVADDGDAATAFDRWLKAHRAGEGPAEEAQDVSKLVGFVLARFRADQVAQGVPPDFVDAVLAADRDRDGEEDPVDLVVLDRQLAGLRAVAATPDFPALLQTFKRVLNITKDTDATPPSADGVPAGVEAALVQAADAVAARVDAAAAALDYEAALTAVLDLRAPLEAFFEGVMVNDDDPAVAARRLGILVGVRQVFRSLADFSRISTR